MGRGYPDPGTDLRHVVRDRHPDRPAHPGQATGSPSNSSSTAPSTAPSTVPTVTPTGPASGVEAAHGSGSAPNLVAVGAALVAMVLVVAGAALYVRRLRGHPSRR